MREFEDFVEISRVKGCLDFHIYMWKELYTILDMDVDS